MKKAVPRNVALWPARSLVLSWIGLLALLALTVALAYAPLGAFNTVGALVIAFIKGLIVASIFMTLGREKPLVVIFAASGFYWLGILLWLTFADYTTRTNFPSAVHLL